MKLNNFRNEPFTNFNEIEETTKYKQSLDKMKAKFGEEIPLIINGEKVFTDEKITSIDPSNSSQVISRCSKANLDHLENALNAAEERFKTWSQTSVEERASIALRVSEIMKRDKHDLSAQMTYEVGKTWAEADGDTAEAIDFMEYYARESLKWCQDHDVVPTPSEKGVLKYIPIGIGAVIPPWNFPFAILAGMTTAAWVTGNTVVLKPSSDSTTIAYRYMEILEEAGLPSGVVNFLPGPGSSIGSKMVTDPRTRFISFTGSMAVGLNINENAAKMSPGQIWIKRVVAEMGGKDAILVDETADIEDAAQGIVSAAYGFQGQKCSACSRLIVHEDVHDELMEKVINLTKKIKIGHPENKEVQLGAVINQAAYKDILNYIEIGKEEGDLVCGGNTAGDDGYFISPTIIDNLDSNSRIMQEEIFGPVLGVTKVSSFEEGLNVANGTIYGLTGAFYTSIPERIKQGANEFHVGNLYINRKCTGALVGVHPFGGFNMSGTDSKAGGPDYLGLFLQAKSIAEKV